MPETPDEKISAAAKSLMVVNGAGIVTLVSLIGSAADHPELYRFIATPLLFSALGFVSAFVAYSHIIFRFSVPRPLPWALTFGSGGFVLAAIINGGLQFALLAFPAS